ncbi:uncharacterized protein LOC128199509 [Bicyclus anynana]|uniref:Uncharacterized protein LOC128199509 n=1 Tax=Bicyclus anynana TaxID=110368 RepID=A0ABM3M1Q0_BICAN|nr:uncharacterized protein LOC128199509 [Bicyclus anynana]
MYIVILAAASIMAANCRLITTKSLKLLAVDLVEDPRIISCIYFFYSLQKNYFHRPKPTRLRLPQMPQGMRKCIFNLRILIKKKYRREGHFDPRAVATPPLPATDMNKSPDSTVRTALPPRTPAEFLAPYQSTSAMQIRQLKPITGMVGSQKDTPAPQPKHRDALSSHAQPAARTGAVHAHPPTPTTSMVGLLQEDKISTELRTPAARPAHRDALPLHAQPAASSGAVRPYPEMTPTTSQERHPLQPYLQSDATTSEPDTSPRTANEQNSLERVVKAGSFTDNIN